MEKRRQLPLPEGIAPSRRAPPALPVDNDVPPPPVPSRPTPGRPSPSAPAVPTSSRPVPRPPPPQNPAPQEEEVYDQAEVGPEEIEDEQQVYDDMDVENELQENYDEFGGVVQEPQETYDEFEGVEQEPQETYDEFEGVEQDTYEIEETQEEYQECDVAPQDPAADIYQIADEDSPSPPPPPPSSAPALPPPRPRQKEETAAPPPPRNTAPKTFANKGGVGIPSIAMGDIQNIKDRLKKVSVRKSEPEQKEPKVYTDSNELQSKFNFFKQKEQEDDSDEEETEKNKKPVLISRFNKPLPPKPNRNTPRVPLKPVIKTNDVKQPNVQVKMKPKTFEENNIEKPNFLSQVNLKHVSRPGEIRSQNDSSVHSQSNKPPIARRDLSPANRPELNLPVQNPTVKNNLPRRTPPSYKPPERNTLSNHTEQDSRPIPSTRPEEKKSFIHAYLEAHPEVSDQRLTSKLNVSDSLPPLPSPVNKDLPPPPLPSPVNKDLPPPPPPLSVMPAHNRDIRPLPTSPAKPQNLSPRGKDGYTKVNFGEEENNNEDGELYEDALSYEDPLLKEKWYFGEIDRMVGNEKLKKFNQNGAYLLRKSTKGGEKQPYTLMVIYKNHVYNLKIRERNDGRMALGEEKPDEMSFKSVVDLIKHHQTNDVILVHRDGKQDTTLLQVSPPK